MAYVLCVDDHPDSVDALVRHLRKRGHRVDVVPNGEDALASLVDRDGRPDAVLLDLHMPVMDGVTFLEIIRSYLKWEDMPVFLVTAMSTESPLVMRAADYRPAGLFLKSRMDIHDVSRAIEALGPTTSPAAV